MPILGRKKKTVKDLWLEYKAKSDECERAFSVANQLEREAKSLWRKWKNASEAEKKVA